MVVAGMPFKCLKPLQEQLETDFYFPKETKHTWGSINNLCLDEIIRKNKKLLFKVF
jgi:hypothetical protein